MRVSAEAFVPPPYPYDRLDAIIRVDNQHDGGAVDLSIGTPCDPAPPEVIAALADTGAAMGYPPSIGTKLFRETAARWVQRRLGAEVDPKTQLAACVGTKEFVASTPQYLKLRDPARDTILYPAISYPTYEMGAILAGLRAVSYTTLDDIAAEEAERALAIWVNSPGNPTGELHDLDAAARWGRERGVVVLSDECYAEFTWTQPPTTILTSSTEGVLAVHSLSKRDNFAGARIGFYSGDAGLVHYLEEVRKHAGLMPPGPVQAAAVVASVTTAGWFGCARSWPPRATTATCRRARSISGCPLRTPGRQRRTWPNAPASWSHRVTSTARSPTDSSGSPRCNQTNASNWPRSE